MSGVDPNIIANADDETIDILLSMIEQCASNSCYELEARLGHLNDNGIFVPGVTRTHMDQLIRGMDILVSRETDEMRTECDEWVEEENYYFTVNQKKMRSRVIFDAQQLKVNVETIEKTIIRSIILKSHIMDVKICLSKETSVNSAPSIINTTHVRLKQRKTFVSSVSPFIVDCCIIWVGKTKTIAEKEQMVKEPLFEIECEFNNSMIMDWKKKYVNNRSKMAKSFMYKIADIMLASGINFVKV